MKQSSVKISDRLKMKMKSSHIFLPSEKGGLRHGAYVQVFILLRRCGHKGVVLTLSRCFTFRDADAVTDPANTQKIYSTKPQIPQPYPAAPVFVFAISSRFARR